MSPYFVSSATHCLLSERAFCSEFLVSLVSASDNILELGFRGCCNFSDGREGIGIGLNLEIQKITKKIKNKNEK